MARGQLDFPRQSESKPVDTVAQALAALGLYCEDEVLVEDDEYWLWPENEQTFWFWVSIQTQWQRDMERRVGLNYAGVESAMRMSGIRKRERPYLYKSIQAMEHAALDEWATMNR